ncbi:hypothetical protein QJS10_CPA09g00893 [Acorus calamus]|uniref:Uncharacterized protein n=1 Tax=Acorus calamus TaxID=4465 RepID=A0AAV9E5X6_ACOCL|nr:hypothetical protein QJS10_CPA09g00893 [Acorus calamus]
MVTHRRVDEESIPSKRQYLEGESPLGLLLYLDFYSPGQRMILPKVQYLIFEGKTINLWFDPWMNGKGLEQYFGHLTYDWGHPKEATLASFIKDGQWARPKRCPVELEMLWSDIQQLEVGGLGDDLLI